MDRPRTFRVRVLGCRVNHAERREIEAVLLTRGLIEAAPGRTADLELVHSCAVTARAAAKSRQAARRSRASGSTLLITGCLVGAERQAAIEIAGSEDRALGHDTPVPEAVAAWFDRSWSPPEDTSTPISPEVDSGVIPLPLAAPASRQAEHVRAEVRVQDGCDAHCTFCIIPTTRPVLRTKSVSTVVEEVSNLVDLGHREVVLTGVFLGAFGHETALRRRQSAIKAEPLADLVDAVANVPGLCRLRLSSLEPGDVSPALIAAFRCHRGVVVPHLHLPLQSGADQVLRRMNRQYRIGAYLDMIDFVQEELAEDGLPPALTTDIICGFPGETDEDFDQTVQVCHRVGYLHMHVFPYSARPGTAAARWTDLHVAPAVAQSRVRRLIDLETGPRGLGHQYRSGLLNREVRLLAEQPDASRPGHWQGRCDHYAMVSVRANCKRGDFIRATARRIEDDVILADAVPADCPLPVLARH